MTIKYNPKRIKFNLGYGVIMIFVGLMSVYSSNSTFSYLWVVLGFLIAGTALYEKKHQYLTLGENKITRHSLIPKSVEISEIKKVRKFRNSYKIETSESTLTINKNIIEPESLIRLDDFLKELNFSV